MRQGWQAIGEYRRNGKLLAGIVAVVGIPVALISTYVVEQGSDQVLTAYLTFAQMIMNSALLFTIVRLARKEPVSVKRAYYDGSGPLVRLLLTTFTLFFISLLLLLGIIILFYGLLAGDSAIGEKLLIMLIALLPGVPGAYLLARTLWAVFRLYETDEGPLQAIRSSWQLSSDRGWYLLGRLIMLGLFLLLLVAVPAGVLLGLQYVTGSTIFNLLLQIVLSLVVLPVANIYLYRLYQGLKV